MRKTVKSLLSFLIIVVLAMSMFTFSVSAASATISGTGEYEVGKTFNVTVRFSADATLYAVEADVNYNSSVLKLNSVSGAEYTVNNGTIKIVDDAFTATKPSKSSSYTLNFTAIAAGNSNITISVLGAGEAESTASASAAITVVTPKPSSNANLSSIKLSNGSLSPAFNANTTNYNVTVKYDVDTINVTGSVADGKSRVTGGGTLGLDVGNNECVLMVTAEDGTKKSYTINIKRMTEEETLAAEKEARDANPLLVVIDGVDYTIVNDLKDVTIPAGFTQGTATRKESEITVLNDSIGRYQLCWLTNAEGAGAFYIRDESDNFTKLAYINANGVMYIVETIEENTELSSEYVLGKYSIDGTEVDAITYEDEAFGGFYIFNCYVPGQAESKYYRYDETEGTMQRAIEFTVGLTADDVVADTDVSTQSQSGGNIIDKFKNMTTAGKIVLLAIVAVAILLIVLAIILIVKIVSSGRDKDYAETTPGSDEFVFGEDTSDDQTDKKD